MLKRRLNFYIRKSHRYLGLFNGLQFLLWTVGSFYFSWMNLKEIRGENLIKTAEQTISLTESLISPNDGLRQINNALEVLKSAKFKSPKYWKIYITK